MLLEVLPELALLNAKRGRIEWQIITKTEWHLLKLQLNDSYDKSLVCYVGCGEARTAS